MEENEKSSNDNKIMVDGKVFLELHVHLIVIVMAQQRENAIEYFNKEGKRETFSSPPFSKPALSTSNMIRENSHRITQFR